MSSNNIGPGSSGYNYLNNNLSGTPTSTPEQQLSSQVEPKNAGHESVPGQTLAEIRNERLHQQGVKAKAQGSQLADANADGSLRVLSKVGKPLNTNMSLTDIRAQYADVMASKRAAISVR
jgi:hypothetical protein